MGDGTGTVEFVGLLVVGTGITVDGGLGLELQVRETSQPSVRSTARQKANKSRRNGGT